MHGNSTDISLIFHFQLPNINIQLHRPIKIGIISWYFKNKLHSLIIFWLYQADARLSILYSFSAEFAMELSFTLEVFQSVTVQACCVFMFWHFCTAVNLLLQHAIWIIFFCMLQLYSMNTGYLMQFVYFFHYIMLNFLNTSSIYCWTYVWL